MTTIKSNGSKWAGQAPDSIGKLIDVLSTHTLDPVFEKYGNFMTFEPRLISGEVLKNTWHFFGNFHNISHVFSIDTDEQEIADKLLSAIIRNQRTPEYHALKQGCKS